MQERTHEKPWPLWLEFLVFGFIGASGIFVDTLILVPCREIFGMDIRLAAIPAFLGAVTWNFELNRRITFKKAKADAPWTRSYLSFVAICALGLGLRILTIHLGIEYFGLRDDRYLHIGSWTVPYLRLSYLANFAGIFVASLFNFLGSKYIAFAPPSGR